MTGIAFPQGGYYILICALHSKYVSSKVKPPVLQGRGIGVMAKNVQKHIREKTETTLKEQGFYKKAVWQRLRRLALQRDNGLCRGCLRKKRITKATEVHHICLVDVYPELALNLSNLESLCRDCHELTKQRRQGALALPARVIKITDGGGGGCATAVRR